MHKKLLNIVMKLYTQTHTQMKGNMSTQNTPESHMQIQTRLLSYWIGIYLPVSHPVMITTLFAGSTL